jgi:tetratricopeptide (TPR) repeat protein
MKGLQQYVVLLAVAVCCLATHPAVFGRPQAGEDGRGVDRFKEVFGEANASYEQGDYEGAILGYAALIDSGVVDTHLFYNLANAYYKNDDFGRAILFYIRALRQNPRDDDARENLDFVRSQLKDKQFVPDRNRIISGIMWPHNNMNTNEMAVLASCFYLLFCVLGIGFIFRKSPFFTALYGRISLLSPGRLFGLSSTQDILVAMGIAAFLFLSCGASAYAKIKRDTRRAEAVVVKSEVPVFSGPGLESILQFKIHEGTVLNVRESRDGWIRIQLPGGLSGWVAVRSVERV